MPSSLPCKMFLAVVLMMGMVWVEVMAVPFPDPSSAAAAAAAASGSGSSSAAAAAAASGSGGSSSAAAAAAASSSRRRGKRHVNIDRLMCFLTASSEGRDGSECGSLPALSPPSCTCVPEWQCRDKGVAAAATGNEIHSMEVEVLSIGCGAPEEVCCVNVDERAPARYSPPVYTKLILARGSNPRRDVMI